MNTQTTVDQLVAEAGRPASGDQYSPARYPYTYAADYIRNWPHVVPTDISDQVIAENPPWRSRSEAARLRALWAAAEGRDDEDMACMLADAYLEAHGIQKPDRTARGRPTNGDRHG